MLPNTQDAVIFGAGAHARVVADAMEKQGVYKLRAFVVDQQFAQPGAECDGLPVIGVDDWLATASPTYFIVAIGNNRKRQTVTEMLEGRGHTGAVVVHPFTSVGRKTELGPGTLLCANSMIDPYCKIGKGVLLNACTGIGHDSVLEDFAQLAAGAGIGANCYLGERVLLAGRSSVLSNIRIGRDSIVGGGALVTKDIPENVMAVGAPARVRTKSEDLF